ncbi:unnamed protein product [Leptosia nina]|uniref:Uncharacterized protein n=1 Tax=Leptosia nina TaxID=320188 RepID=A0AAV1JKM5_9NEOP
MAPCAATRPPARRVRAMKDRLNLEINPEISTSCAPGAPFTPLRSPPLPTDLLYTALFTTKKTAISQIPGRALSRSWRT